MMLLWSIALVAAAALVLLILNRGQVQPQRGELAPSFALPDQSGVVRTLDEFRGRVLVLYFYPRDDTPG